MKPKIDSYLVRCLKCKGSAAIKIINGREVMYIDHTPIIAARFRPDEKWGFECMCGNDTRLAPQEKSQSNVLVSGASQDVVKRIVRACTQKPETKFKMEAM